MTTPEESDDAVERRIEERAEEAAERVSADALEASEAIQELARSAATIVTDHAKQTTQATQDVVAAQKRTKNTIVVLSISVLLMLVVGLAVGVFLLARSNDIQNVQNRIENKTSETQRIFCAFMEQRAVIKTTPDDKLLANQAEILIRRLGCEPNAS